MLDYIKDWHNIDFLCVKAKDGVLYEAVYYLDGHPEFEKRLSECDIEFMKYVQRLGCYGTAETVVDGTDDIDRFYIRLNIKDHSQEECLVQYLIKDRKLDDEQKSILKYFLLLDTAVCCYGDYKPLYYCGFSKRSDSSSLSSIRYYFKTYGLNDTDSNDIECINYLERCSRIREDDAFEAVKNLVLAGKAGLKCIGLEFNNELNTKIKYYLHEIPNGFSVADLLEDVKCYAGFSESAKAISLKISDLEDDLKCYWLQLTSGYHNNDYSVNAYIEKINKIKKYYSLVEGIVLRDIGGVYFLVDIHEKQYYIKKELFKVNEIGRAIIIYMMDNNICSLEGIVSYLRTIIVDYHPEMYSMMYSDCAEFIKQLKKYGYVEEVI